jgi:chromosome segregation ATPase
MKLFSGRIAQLETMKQILTQSTRARAQRVGELERMLERVELELQALRKRAKELEDHNRQLTEAVTQRASRIQELERELQEVAIQHVPLINQQLARLANAESRLQDSRRLTESYAAIIGRLEAQLANAEARLADAQRREPDLASADNTTLERLFEAYGLIDLARGVKARRLKAQNWRKAAKAD